MPSKKLRDNAVVRWFREFDMFGRKAKFNINGESKHRTCPGALVSLCIFAWLGIVLHYLIVDIVIDDRDRPITEILYPNYYGKTNAPIQ